MAVFKFSKDSTTPLVADKAGTWVLAASNALTLDSANSIDGISTVAGIERVKLNILGDITLTGAGEHIGVHVKSDATPVMVGNSSTIKSTLGVGVDDMLATAKIVFNGDFEGVSAIGSGAAETTVTIGKNGSLTTTGNAIWLIGSEATDTSMLKVSGEINAGMNKAFVGGMGADTVSITRTGKITGDLDLGAGNDIVKIAKGEAFTGKIFGGAGDDLFMLKSADTVIVENAAEGKDTVNIGETFTLGANVDDLVLTGNKAIDGNGNELANALTGNNKANKLSGLDGDDTLDGGKGNDELTGGNGADTFLFHKAGGRDKIIDFVDGTDKIKLDLGAKFDTFEKIADRIEVVDGNSLINLGSVRIEVTGATALDATDFIF